MGMKAQADVDVETDTQVRNTLEFTLQGGTSIEKRPYPHTHIPILPNTLPAVYIKEKWVIWDDPLWVKNGMTVEQMKKMKRRRLKQRVTLVSKPLEKNKDPIRFITWMPNGERSDDEVLAYVRTRGRDFENLEAAIAEACWHGKRKTGTRRALVLLRVKRYVVGRLRVIGGSASPAKMIGPSGKTDDVAISGIAGAGFGKTTTTVDDIDEVKVICYNDGPLTPPSAPPEKMKPVAKKKEPAAKEIKVKVSVDPIKVSVAPLALVEPKKVALPELPEVTIYFDFDSFQLKPEEGKKIPQMVKWLAENPEHRVQAEGHTCLIGSADYNVKLARKRALAVTMAAIDLFEKNYGLSREKVMPNLILQYVSVGEDKPIVQNTTKEGGLLNRRVIFRIVGPASGQ